MSLLLCDIDRFKNINDFHGHLAWRRRVLQEMAVRLRDAVRSKRYAVRARLWRGRVSACAQRLSSITTCRIVQQKRFGEMINSNPFETECGPISVSLSIGAITIQNWDSSQSIEPFLRGRERSDVSCKGRWPRPSCLCRVVEGSLSNKSRSSCDDDSIPVSQGKFDLRVLPGEKMYQDKRSLRRNR